VILSCHIEKDIPPMSPGGDFTAFSNVGTGLQVKSQMLQCVETEHTETHKNKGGGGGTTTVHTYTYSVEWKDSYESDSNFHAKGSSNWRSNCGASNPTWPSGLPVNRARYAPQIHVGVFASDMAYKVPLNTPIFTDKESPQVGGWEPHQKGSDTFFSNNLVRPGTNNIGAMKVSFYSNDWTQPTVTLLGQNNNGVIGPWKAPPSWGCSGNPLQELEMGKQSTKAVFDTLRSQNAVLTWVLRIAGLVGLWIAFCLCFGPLEVAADCVPCVGPMIGDGIQAIACCVSCLPATACCLGVAGVVWVAMRPAVGIPLLAFWLVVVVGFSWFIAKSRKAKQGARNPQVSSSGTSLPQNLVAPLNTVPVVAQPVSKQMSVQVPQGCGPGSVLQVDTPSGPMQLTVPNGYQAGSTFLMSY
jgi:hypothetical protein